MTKLNLMTKKADIVASIKDISVAGAKLDRLIWEAAASVVLHIDKHHDVTLANDLVAAMPKGSRVNALIAYFEHVAKVDYDTDEKLFKHNKAKTTNIELSQNKSWVDYKPEQPYAGFDLKAQIAALIAKADKAAKITDADKKAKVDVKEADLTELKAFATKLGVDLSTK